MIHYLKFVFKTNTAKISTKNIILFQWLTEHVSAVHYQHICGNICVTSELLFDS